LKSIFKESLRDWRGFPRVEMSSRERAVIFQILGPHRVDTDEQWERANKSLSVLDGKVKYSVVPGNHDHPLTYYYKYFPVSRFSDEKWFGG